MFNAGFAQKVIEEVNKIRLNPKTYSNKIRGYLSCFQGNILRIPKQPGLMTNEGKSAYQEAADFLLSLPKLKALTSDKGLNNVAQDMANELTRCSEFEQMDTIDREAIINRYGRYEGKFGESTDFGSQTPEMVVINLLVDDGNKSRSNRKMLFQEAYNKIGVGCAPHNKFKSITVLMYATNYISNEGRSTGPTTHTTTSKYTKIVEREEPGYTKQITTEEQIIPSGVRYRYVNNVDPNKDLICDTANYGPVNNKTATFSQESFQQPTQSVNTAKVGGGGILNTNVESSGWTPSLQNSEYVKARERAQKEDLMNNQFRSKIPDVKSTNVGGGGSILNTNVESSGWTPSLQRNYKPPQPEQQNDYMSRVRQDAKVQKVGGGGSILNTNVESSGWVTDFEKQKSPEYWRAKQEYQDNYKANIPLGTTSTQVGGGGAILNTNVESTDWNDYSGYERRMPYYHQEKQYDAYPKEQQGPKAGTPGTYDMQGVEKVEQSERIVNENGRKLKVVKLVKYMENGEIKTEISKVPL